MKIVWKIFNCDPDGHVLSTSAYILEHYVTPFPREKLICACIPSSTESHMF